MRIAPPAEADGPEQQLSEPRSKIARMKVGLISPGFSSDPSDEYIPVLDNVVRELSARVEVHVFSLRYPRSVQTYDIYGATVHAIGGGSARRAGRLPMLLRALVEIVREHRRAPFDVLHGVWIDESGSIAVLAARMLGLSSVVTVMGGELVAFPELQYGGGLTRSNSLLSSFALRGAQRITVACAPIGRQVEGVIPPSQYGKIVRLVWGVDPTPFRGPAREIELEGTYRVLHVAGLRPPKDQPLLLRAFARLQQEEDGAHLHIAGSGPLLSTLESQVKALGLSGAVTFHGHLTRATLASMYRSAHVLAISSRNEGQLVVALEAALSDLAIVGTDVGVIADLAPHAALAVPVLDEVLLARALCRARDPSLRARVTTAASKVARAEFEAATTAERLVQLYQTLSA
jgi:glycosyltransferase involved in cell wall biosynthesis